MESTSAEDARLSKDGNSCQTLMWLTSDLTGAVTSEVTALGLKGFEVVHEMGA